MSPCLQIQQGEVIIHVIQDSRKASLEDLIKSNQLAPCRPLAWPQENITVWETLDLCWVENRIQTCNLISFAIT